MPLRKLREHRELSCKRLPIGLFISRVAPGPVAQPEPGFESIGKATELEGQPIEDRIPGGVFHIGHDPRDGNIAKRVPDQLEPPHETAEFVERYRFLDSLGVDQPATLLTSAAFEENGSEQMQGIARVGEPPDQSKVCAQPSTVCRSIEHLPSPFIPVS